MRFETNLHIFITVAQTLFFVTINNFKRPFISLQTNSTRLYFLNKSKKLELKFPFRCAAVSYKPN